MSCRKPKSCKRRFCRPGEIGSPCGIPRKGAAQRNSQGSEIQGSPATAGESGKIVYAGLRMLEGHVFQKAKLIRKY